MPGPSPYDTQSRFWMDSAISSLDQCHFSPYVVKRDPSVWSGTVIPPGHHAVILHFPYTMYYISFFIVRIRKQNNVPINRSCFHLFDRNIILSESDQWIHTVSVQSNPHRRSKSFHCYLMPLCYGKCPFHMYLLRIDKIIIQQKSVSLKRRIEKTYFTQLQMHIKQEQMLESIR